MLQTLNKMPKPQYLTYPVGAELVSKHIEQVCLDKEILGIHFYTGQLPQSSASRPVSTLVATANYTKVNNGYFIKQGTKSQCWSVCIFSVYKENRARIKALMCLSGFESLATWLQKKHHETWFLKGHHIHVSYHSTEDTLIAEVF